MSQVFLKVRSVPYPVDLELQLGERIPMFFVVLSTNGSHCRNQEKRETLPISFVVMFPKEYLNEVSVWILLPILVYIHPYLLIIWIHLIHLLSRCSTILVCIEDLDSNCSNCAPQENSLIFIDQYSHISVCKL